MAVSYKKLWKMLIDRDMKKKDLCAAAGISHASMAKLGKTKMLQQMYWSRFALRYSVTLAILWNSHQKPLSKGGE